MPQTRAARLTGVGRWGLALLALHTLLLFLPPVPPVHKGYSVPGYGLSLVVTALLAIEIGRQAPALLDGWASAASARLRALIAELVVAGLGLALVFRQLAPEPFSRFSREEGLWEPLTVTCYLAGAIFLWRSTAADRGAPDRSVPSRGAPDPEARKPWRLLALAYVWLALEEVDYFGIFGGLIGRIQGVYAGSLHDVIRLTAFGIMGVVAWVVLIAALLLVAVILWRKGYLKPAWIARRLMDPRVAWALAGLAFQGLAALDDAEMFGALFAVPTPEEAIELAGGALLAVYALEEAAGPASGR